MKKTLSLLVAVAFACVGGFAPAQAAPAQSLVPSVQAAPGGSPKAEVKAKAKSKAKKTRAPRSKKAKAR
ncbi:MAG: hypothetical protein A3H35_02810 [Betaproteobacteria bacterium RIFCSPLOWO2_02_FULL_62_17]|nr:MAG: hypothetical protein A3H35_02810 [Betaproteobacteria bacterium RIFCSPLOWO2_02_FULL_62_17]